MKTKFVNIASGSFFFSLFLLLVPCHAQGFVLDLAKKQTIALSEKFGPMMAFFIAAVAFLAIGYSLLWISTFLLNGIIAITPTALTVTTGGASQLITYGWNFTAGLVNMILIIAFIVIAFAVILGSEKIQMKKALPNLIIVALLVNFTLLFVGIGIDISNFLFNTIANQFMSVAEGEKGNILLQSVTGLFDFSLIQIGAVGITLATITAGLAVPYVSTAVMIGTIILFPALLSSIFQFLVYGGIMFLLSGVFFFYFLVFLIRIFIIQILAVMAPLAFFCLIFDETKKYWDQWRQALIQWLLVGVVFIFLMYFGLAMAPLIRTMAEPFHKVMPGGDMPMIGWWADAFVSIIGYIALLAYFIVIVGIAKRFIPAAAQTMISQASSIAKAAAPWAGAIAKGAGRRVRSQEMKRQEDLKGREPLEKRRGLWGVASKVKTKSMRAQSWAVRGFHGVAGKNVPQEAKEDVKAQVENIEKTNGENYEDFAKTLTPLRMMAATSSFKMAALQYMSKGGGEALAKIEPETLSGLINEAAKRGDSKTIREAVKHIPDRVDVDDCERKLVEARQVARDEIGDRASGMSNESLNAEIEGNKEVEKAKKNLSAANKIQSAMMPHIRKIDSNISVLEGELEQRMIGLAVATQQEDNDLILEANTNIEETKRKIKEAKRNAIYKMSAQSLKNEDIEKLSESTVNSPEFLKAMVQHRDVNFITRMLENRRDAATIRNRLSAEMMEIGVGGLQTTNPILFNQIRRMSSGQAIFSEMHGAIMSAEREQRQRERQN